MYQTDKIAILLATYNGEKYIVEQIESILAQTESGWTLFIHDDGSSDGTREIIGHYTEKYPDKIIEVGGAPTGSAKNNFFYLFHQVEAPYYMCCDQDDVWLPEKISVTKKAMESIEEEDTKPCLVFTELRVVDENLETMAEKMSDYQGLDCKTIQFNRMLIQNVVTGCTMMVNRALCEEMRRLTEYDKVLMHDWWAALVATAYGNTYFIQEPTMLYRQHGKNSVGAKNTKRLSYLIKKMFDTNKNAQSLSDTRQQAGLFGEIYEDSDGVLARLYSGLDTKSKWQRLLFYKKNGIRKSTFSKNLGLLIWG